MIIEKPKVSDLKIVEIILKQWTDKEEVVKYLARISSEISGGTEFNMQFWVARDSGKPVGVIGLSDPLPKVLQFTKTEKPGEIKILYVDSNYQGKGTGRILVNHIEKKAKEQNYKELIVRSAERYKDTAYGFYEKMGYAKAGILNDEKDGKPMQVFEKII